ncbi:MAG: hypothetical protein U0R77_00200 [Mycolicibacterium insubricum]
MNLAASVERALGWLATPRKLATHLEMHTQRGRRFELEVVSVAIRWPGSGVAVSLPVLVTLLPRGSSPAPDSATASDESVGET